jgi:periodic tryptophan protein 2
MKDNKAGLEAELRTVEKAVRRIQSELARLADENVYAIEYLLAQPVGKKRSEIGYEVKAIGQDGTSGDEEMVDGDDGEEEGAGEWLGFE